MEVRNDFEVKNLLVADEERPENVSENYSFSESLRN